MSIIKKEVQYMRTHKKEFIPLLPLVISILWMIGTAKADQTFWPLLQASQQESKPWVLDCPQLTYYAPEQQEKVCYLWQISKSKDFLFTLRAENGTFDPKRRSNIIGANGHWDHGLCQLNSQWHSKFIKSPQFNDWHEQAKYCLEVYKKRPTAFYGYNVRHRQTKYFTF